MTGRKLGISFRNKKRDIIICLVIFALAGFMGGISFKAQASERRASSRTSTDKMIIHNELRDVGTIHSKNTGVFKRVEHLVSENGRIFVDAFYISASACVLCLSVIWVFIRAMRKKRRRLARMNEMYHLLMDNTAEGVMMAVSGKLTIMNRRASHITGYFPHELTSRVFAEIINPKDRDSVKEVHSRILKSEIANLRFPFRIVCKNGDTKWLLNNSVRVTWNDVPGILCLFSDITESKQLEQQFLQAQKMEAIGQLAGGIAHDFNNILTAISGYGNLLRIKTQDDPAVSRYARNILACADRAANLVKSLLAFSRKQTNDPKPTDLHDIIQSSEKMLRHIIGEHIELSIVLSKASPVILADSNHIVQVLINLAANARDAVQGNGKITIRTSTVDTIEEPVLGDSRPKTAKYAILTFEDTGVGINDSIIEKIFDPFFTTKSQDKSSGLGLATIFGIVKQQKGYVAVQTLVGLGTRFNIYLPIIEALADKSPIRIPVHPRGSETILVCEDESDIRKLIREILESNGYSVIEAKDGQEGIDSFRQNIGKIDLVLLDVMMPRKSGKDVFETIIEFDPCIKTLFMTGYASETLTKAGLNNVESNCLFKPIETDVLLCEIRKRLDES
ncbi:MAG: hybrid sensor histidine kinase/response regulator [Syntrophorhabdaceae bacterium]